MTDSINLQEFDLECDETPEDIKIIACYKKEARPFPIRTFRKSTKIVNRSVFYIVGREFKALNFAFPPK